jgi:hypothetical protein
MSAPTIEDVRGWSAQQLNDYLKPRICRTLPEAVYARFEALQIRGRDFIEWGSFDCWISDHKLVIGLACALYREVKELGGPTDPNVLAMGANLRRSKYTCCPRCISLGY